MPLSKRPAARARQLANLQPAPAAPAENRRAVKHGGYAAIARGRLSAKVNEVFEALAADAPLRDSAGDLPSADRVQVVLLAQCLCRLEDVAGHVSLHGAVRERSGKLRPAAELEQRLRREAADYLDAMAMTPRSRGKLGLDLVRTADAATALSEPDPERRAELLDEAGLSVETEVPDG